MIIRTIVIFTCLVFTLSAQGKSLSISDVKSSYKEWLNIYQNEFQQFLKDQKVVSIEGLRQKFKGSVINRSGVRDIIFGSCLASGSFECNYSQIRPFPYAMLIIFKNSVPVHYVKKGEIYYVYLMPKGRLKRLYRLPMRKLKKDGTLERNILPFASYKFTNGKMKIRNISKEFYQLTISVTHQLTD